VRPRQIPIRNLPRPWRKRAGERGIKIKHIKSRSSLGLSVKNQRPHVNEPGSFFRKIGPDMLERRGGGGFLSIFGMPFLLGGLFIMQVPLGIIPVNTDSASLPWFVFVLFGLPFAAVGAVLVFGRNGLTIDLGARRIYRWWGLIVPMKRKSEPLDLFSRVRFDKHEGDSDTAATWPVSLVGETYAGRLTVDSPTDYAEGRRGAEELAEFLNLPLEDVTTGKKVVREPGSLNEPLRERVRRTGEDVRSLPPEPPDMKTRIAAAGNGYIISIPEPDGFRKSVPYLIFSVVFGLVMGWFFIRPVFSLSAPDSIRYMFGAFFTLLAVGPLLGALKRFLLRKTRLTIVTFTPAFFSVEERDGHKSIVKEIPADELEDLILPTRKAMLQDLDYTGMSRKQPLGDTGTPRMPDGRPVPKILLSLMKLAPGPGITAVSDRAIVTFGRGLPEPELAYIHGLIRKTIAGQ